MPIITESHILTRELTREQVVGFTCDRCGVEYHDDIAMQECFTWNTTGGYGSVWGDGRSWEVVLCQGCAFTLLRAYARDVTECSDAG